MNFRRIKRHTIFLTNYIFKEKIRGLDFTMRDKHLLVETQGTLHGYSITPKKHLKEIFNNFEITNNDSIIDIGCGKGFVLWYLSKFKFKKIVGIDIDERLINIAKKNFEKLKISNVNALQLDATKFENAKEFNYFFFFNPFSIEVFKKVYEKIVRSLQDNPRKITIIYYNPTCAHLFVDDGCFRKTKELYDPIKNYNTYIYESI